MIHWMRVRPPESSGPELSAVGVSWTLEPSEGAVQA